jgi:peptidoglycan-associated lipoprotein
MKEKKTVFIFTLAVFAAALVLAGCAKKVLEPIPTGVPAAVTPQAAPPEAAGEPSMEMEPVPQARAAGQAPGAKRAPIEEVDVYFEYDSFDLSPRAKKVLADAAAFLNDHPGVKVQIEGHCDERGTSEYNLALGERRAKAAHEYLVFLGVDAKRLSTVSYGEERPVDPGHNEQAWAKNRRVHFSVLEG